MKSAAPALADVADVALLGHQGGWDEILLVVGPLAVVAGLLWLANKRVTAQLEEAEQEASEGTHRGADALPEGGRGVDGSPETDPRH